MIFAKHRTLKFALVFIFIIAAFVILKPATKTYADYLDCGIETGNVHDFAGLVVDFKVREADGTIVEAQNASASVTTYKSPDGDGEISPANIDADHINSVIIYQGTQPEEAGTSNNVCAYNSAGTQVNGFTDLHLAIMGGIYATSQSPSTTAGYVLDCDHSVGTFLSQFTVTGNGVPSNGTSGGYWTSDVVDPENGQSWWLQLTYHDPPTAATPVLECDGQQNTYYGNVQENTQYTFQLVIDDYGGTSYFIPPGTAPAPSGQTAEYFYYALIDPDGSTTGWHGVSINNGPSITAGHGAVLNLPLDFDLTGQYTVEFKATDSSGNATYMVASPCRLYIPVVNGTAQNFICPSETNPYYLSPNTTYNFNVGLTNNGGTTAYFDPPQPDTETPSERFAYEIVYPSGAISFRGYTGTVTPSPGTVAQGQTASGQVSFLTPATTGTYVLNYEAINNNTNDVDMTSGNCSYSFVVTPPPTEPFFSVLGGNIESGIGYGISGCTVPSTTMGIEGFDTNSGSTYYGASGQGAALATGSISGYASGENPDYSAVNSAFPTAAPNSLSFSNNATSGNLGLTFPSCVEDYYSQINLTGNNSISSGTAVSSLGAGTYYDNGAPLTLNGGVISAGTNKTIIIVVKNANVYLTGGDITYGSYMLSTMPSFELVVYGGNIYVNSADENLEGTYIAEPSSGVGGSIITCSSGIGVSDNNSSYINTCDNPLNFIGAVSAYRIEMLRTYGDAQAGSSSVPAETFTYSPEVWLPETATPSSNPPVTQSLISLPPIL